MNFLLSGRISPQIFQISQLLQTFFNFNGFSRHFLISKIFPEVFKNLSGILKILLNLTAFSTFSEFSRTCSLHFLHLNSFSSIFSRHFLKLNDFFPNFLDSKKYSLPFSNLKFFPDTFFNSHDFLQSFYKIGFSCNVFQSGNFFRNFFNSRDIALNFTNLNSFPANFLYFDHFDWILTVLLATFVNSLVFFCIFSNLTIFPKLFFYHHLFNYNTFFHYIVKSNGSSLHFFQI